MKNEPKKLKEDPEKVARRERARKRRENRAAAAKEVADAPERPRVKIKLRKVTYSPRDEDSSGGSDKSPQEPEGAVPIREKAATDPRRLKAVITMDNMMVMQVNPLPDSSKVQLCNLHYDKLEDKLELHGIEHMISSNSRELRERLEARSIDPLWHAQEALIRLAIKAVGTEGVILYRCPACALAKFDYVSQAALAMKQACVRKTQ
jgi:hypothetical protein